MPKQNAACHQPTSHARAPHTRTVAHDSRTRGTPVPVRAPKCRARLESHVVLLQLDYSLRFLCTELGAAGMSRMRGRAAAAIQLLFVVLTSAAAVQPTGEAC